VARGAPVERNLLVATLLDAGRAAPDKVAVVSVRGDLTYRQLDALSARLAHALVDAGVATGQRVAVQVDKRPEVLALNLACARLGAIYVPLNPAYTDAEVVGLLDVATPTLLVRDRPVDHPTTRLRLDELLTDAARRPESFHNVVADASTPAAMLFTSGTTGRPKGALLTQGNLVFGATTLNDVWGIGPHDVLVHVLPLFHVHGLFVAAYCALASGATIRLLEGFDLDEVLAVLPDSTLVMGVPTHYTRLLGDERFTRDLVSSIRLFISGSAPMLRSTHEEFHARTGHWILERYGMTETGMITSNPLHGVRKPGTVGPALPGVHVRVTGGSPGRVEVRGPNVFDQYWGQPELRDSEFTEDGYFVTGDLGVLDADGYLEIVGRSKDVIITGGLNVYPTEVERVVDEFPGVGESAVVGIRDPDFGEAVVAVVVTLPGARLDVAALRRHARAVLAPFKVPRHVVVVDDLPRNAMGKVEKARLRRDVVARGCLD
jgi:malonyl-CoA/methylmalonyl-CoA synthetase